MKVTPLHNFFKFMSRTRFLNSDLNLKITLTYSVLRIVGEQKTSIQEGGRARHAGRELRDVMKGVEFIQSLIPQVPVI